VRVDGNFESNSSEALREAALAGLGIAYSPLWIFGDDLRAGKLKMVMPGFRPTPLPLNVVYQPSRRPSLKVKSFVDYFADVFALDPDIAPMMEAG
jgi:DNA-binding transcriptional LysR family regulator